MKYKYTAMNSKNQKKEGTIDASSQTEAIASLRSKGLIVQDIVETGAPTESIWDLTMPAFCPIGKNYRYGWTNRASRNSVRRLAANI